MLGEQDYIRPRLHIDHVNILISAFHDILAWGEAHGLMEIITNDERQAINTLYFKLRELNIMRESRLQDRQQIDSMKRKMGNQPKSS